MTTNYKMENLASMFDGTRRGKIVAYVCCIRCRKIMKFSVYRKRHVKMCSRDICTSRRKRTSPYYTK